MELDKDIYICTKAFDAALATLLQPRDPDGHISLLTLILLSLKQASSITLTEKIRKI